jgi:nucleotide-binding universal stress UspA family protein
LHALVERCERLAPGVDVHAETLSGDPVALLTKLADESAMTVVGASGQTMSQCVQLGSTAAELARRVTTPFVVVRHEPPCAHRPVVIGVDGSADGRAAVRAGFAFAERAGSPVEAVHAWSDLPLEALGAPDIDTVGARQDATELLSEQVADARQRHPGVPVRELVVLDRPMALLLARAAGAALLVVGRHGRARAGEMPLGSVGHALLHYAPCPVMVVR